MKRILYPWAVAVAICVGLPHVASAELVSVTGQVSGITDIDKDRIIDGAVVLPSFSAEDLFTFQMDQFMGPSETITIGGFFSAQVPGNFFLPKQKEKYGLFPVNIEKSTFTIQVEPGQSRELVTAWFQVPWDALLDMNSNGLPATSLLPQLTIKKHGYATQRDWSTVSSIQMNLDRNLGPKLRYTWNRAATTGSDMDSLFVFQSTGTDRWVMANLKGAPAATGEIESITGLSNSFKTLFMRTHNDANNDVGSAEGWIRSATLANRITVNNVPPALTANLAGTQRVEWTPIAANGWMSLVLSPITEAREPSLFLIDGLFGHVFARTPNSEQIWLDANAGNTGTVLGSHDLTDFSVMLAFIGTSSAVAMPQDGQDNSAFINAASEIRMKKLK